MSQQNFQTERQNEISKRNFQTKFLTVISKRNIQTNIQTKFPSSFQTEQKLLVQNRAANSYPPAYPGCHAQAYLMVNHRGGRRDSFPLRLLSFLIKSTKYIFVSSSRLVFLLDLGITFSYIKLISKLLNPNNHQHNKTNKPQLCWRYLMNRNEHQYPLK